MKCSKCNMDAVAHQPYSGAHLCRKHLIEDVERKVKKDIRQLQMVEKNDSIAVALSGGKDSVVLLYLLHKLFSKRPDITLFAVTIDEGISGYREHTIEIAQKVTDMLGIQLHVISMKGELGKSLDEVAAEERDKGACSFCGVFRKKLLNMTARKLGATKLAVGHNLDDEAQTAFLNVLRGDVGRMSRMHKKQQGLVFRIKPLRSVPEKEVALYAILQNLPVDFSECPYAHEAMRGEVRDIINSIEVKHPGTKYSILRGSDETARLLNIAQQDVTLSVCSVCGEPTAAEVCQSCRLLGQKQDMVDFVKG